MLHNFRPGQKIKAEYLNSLPEERERSLERLNRLLLSPFGVGLLYDPDYPFQIAITGDDFCVHSISALLASGHLIRYKNNRDHGPLLRASLADLNRGEYFAHLVYEDEYIPTVSNAKFGRTDLADIRVPAYSIRFHQEILSLEDFPNALALAKITVFDYNKALPEIDDSYYPLISQLGGHPKGMDFMVKTKAYHRELSDASLSILREVRSVPESSIFIDIKYLAQALDSFLKDWSFRIRHWAPKDSFFDMVSFWSSLAQIFRKYTKESFWARRQDDTLRMLYSAGKQGGQFDVERFFLPTIDTLSEHKLSYSDITQTIDLLETMILYVAFSWARLGSGKALRSQEEVIYTNRF